MLVILSFRVNNEVHADLFLAADYLDYFVLTKHPIRIVNHHDRFYYLLQ
jgi:hypothetical protein